MHRYMTFRRRMLAGLAALTGMTAGGVATAQQPAAPAASTRDAGEVKVGKLGELTVPIGGIATFDPRVKEITDVELSNPDVLDVKVLPPDLKKVQLVGKLGGASKMTLVFTDRTKAVYTVIVSAEAAPPSIRRAAAVSSARPAFIVSMFPLRFLFGSLPSKKSHSDHVRSEMLFFQHSQAR